MEKFKDQSQRLEMVLMAKGEYSIECNKCPLRKQCLPWCDELSKLDYGSNPNITCEDLLTWYIIHGDFLPTACP